MSDTITSMTITRGDAYLAAAIFESFARIERRDNDARRMTGADSLAEDIGTSFERWLGSAFLLSCEVAQALGEMVDWDEMAGVFTYEHLEADTSAVPAKDASLPATLWCAISLEGWHSLAESAGSADKSWLRGQIAAWAAKQNVPLIGFQVKPVAECSDEELAARFGGYHPVHTRNHWLTQTLHQNCDLGYWAWVRTQLAAPAPELA